MTMGGYGTIGNQRSLLEGSQRLWIAVPTTKNVLDHSSHGFVWASHDARKLCRRRVGTNIQKSCFQTHRVPLNIVCESYSSFEEIENVVFRNIENVEF